MTILLDIIQSWVKWLIYSPTRLVFIVVAVGALILGAIIFNRANEDASSGAATETTSAGVPSTSVEAEATPGGDAAETALTPEETTAAQTLAMDFVKAWAARPDSTEKWLAGVEPYCTEELKSRMQWVEPRQSDDYTVDVNAPVRKTDPLDDGSDTFGVLTDKGLVYVEVVKDEAGALKANKVFTGVDGE
jgi:hypothetical protein